MKKKILFIRILFIIHFYWLSYSWLGFKPSSLPTAGPCLSGRSLSVCHPAREGSEPGTYSGQPAHEAISPCPLWLPPVTNGLIYNSGLKRWIDIQKKICIILHYSISLMFCYVFNKSSIRQQIRSWAYLHQEKMAERAILPTFLWKINKDYRLFSFLICSTFAGKGYIKTLIH